MGTGYTRNDTSNNIADGNVINASDLDGEFDAVQAAFNGTTGHSHDGTSGEGPQIAAGGIASDAVTTAKILNANVTLAKMAANSVDSDQYVDGSIDRVHLAADIVDGTKIADDSIDSEHYVDGSIDTAHIANDAVTLGTKTSGNYVAAGATSGTGISGSVSSEGGTFTVTSNATNANTASTIVARDGSGNFSAGTITASLTGTASNAALLDSLDSTQFLRSDAADTKTSGSLNFSDNVALQFGASQDLQLYHDAVSGNSYVYEQGAGSLIVQGTNIQHKATDGTSLAEFNDAGAVNLRYSGDLKLATKSDGVDITGELQSDSLDVDGVANISSTLTMSGGNIDFADGVEARFGNGADLRIYHDGSNLYIDDAGQGNLRIRGNDGVYIQKYTGEPMIYAVADGEVILYHDNSAKLTTTSSGVDISGDINDVTNIYLENQIFHAGDTDTFMQFHAANEWRVVTGNTEMLEINDSYLLLGANSVGSVHTASVTGSQTPNFHVYNSFVWTLTGNLTLANPSTETAGMSGVFVFIHSEQVELYH